MAFTTLGGMWDEPTSVALAAIMATSYEILTGSPLVAATTDVADAMYKADFGLLCHDGSNDPLFTYANARSQSLWKRTWDELIGMPSRLSAEPDERESRLEMLARAQRDGFVNDYFGVRVASDGSRFLISEVTIWNVTDEYGHRVGQAARIPTVAYLA